MSMTKKLLIEDRITLKKGEGGLPYLELRFKGAEAHVYLYGGHVLHYQPAGQSPVLWASKKSWFEKGKPIRGGIPICWPWFGLHPSDSTQPGHGFARLAEWTHLSSSATETETQVSLQMPKECCADVSLQITVKLDHRLSVTLTTVNHRKTEFCFTEALHTYFSVGDIHSAYVTGLEGQRYINKLSADKLIQTQEGTIAFSSETELVYNNSSHACTLVDPVLKRKTTISKKGSLSTVVWNPWIEKSIRMPDFGDDEFLKMACVETANCGSDAITLHPGQTHDMSLQIETSNIS